MPAHSLAPAEVGALDMGRCRTSCISSLLIVSARPTIRLGFYSFTLEATLIAAALSIHKQVIHKEEHGLSVALTLNVLSSLLAILPLTRFGKSTNMTS